MELIKVVSFLTDPRNRRSCLCSIVPTALLCIVFFIGFTFIPTDYKGRESILGISNSLLPNKSNLCKNQPKPHGSEPLPKGIISKTSNLETRPLWGSPKKEKNKNGFMSLLAIAVGIKQKKNVDRIVKKFPSSDFVIMLFHYDGVVDGWSDLSWNHKTIHVSAIRQTKWWFAKRFLHPDIVAEYKYVFLWDEDLGVDYFDPLRYLKIVADEGLEISQPALDATNKSEVHHQITARGRNTMVHRRIYKAGGDRGCDGKSTDPPCTGWVEMMAPVFSAAAWRCTWYLIQNDLTHAWGLDKELGHCAQGDRTKNVGVVDAEYIVHQNLPTLGENENKAPLGPHQYDARSKVRSQSYRELRIFQDRWKKAAEEDKCWKDPYHHHPTNKQ